MLDDNIIFSDVQPGSSAVYQCNVSNDYGYLLANAFVNVLCELIPPRCVYAGMLFSIYIDFFFGEGNNGAIIAGVSPQRSRPEC